jgi:hypothetical protein
MGQTKLLDHPVERCYFNANVSAITPAVFTRYGVARLGIMETHEERVAFGCADALGDDCNPGVIAKPALERLESCLARLNADDVIGELPEDGGLVSAACANIEDQIRLRPTTAS